MSTFSDPACLLVAWSQGAVGTLLAVSALTVGAGLYYRYRWAYALVVSFVIALSCYFEPETILHLFNITPQSCAMTYANFEKERSNMKICEQILGENKRPGEYCTCNGLTASPSCESYANACASYLPAYQTSGNTCTCGFADSAKNAIPSCANQPMHATAQITQTNACTDSTGGWVGAAEYCTDTSIPHQAHFIAPEPGASNDGTIVGNAYYTEQTEINNPSGAPITVTWYGESDNSGWYFLNGAQVGYNPNWNELQTMTITLQPGVNVLDTTVENYPGSSTPPNYGPNPSGTVDEIVGNGGQVYSATGSSNAALGNWKEVSGPPVAPSPPPNQPETNCYTQSCAPS